MKNKNRQQRNVLSPGKHIIASCVFILSMSVVAEEAEKEKVAVKTTPVETQSPQAEKKALYTRKGADTCLKCHDEYFDKYPVLEIFFTKHGDRQNPRSPMAQLQCESCHGPGRAHATEPLVGKKRAPIFTFGKKSKLSLTDQNNVCLQCHSDANRATWKGSAHASQNMACVDCHSIHIKKDPVLSSSDQSSVCLTCHKKQKSEFSRRSAHPVRQGQVSCTQCHNPHGSFFQALLKTATKNDTCYQCHAEKRGPYLWAHGPVQEDCGICHEHHGSIEKSLLKKRAPYLCQQCHSGNLHPSFSYDSSSLSNAANNNFVLAKSCLNCHYQVHGSNHPSGVKLMR